MTRRIFLISPTRMSGDRARLLASPRARFELAHRFQRDGAPLGDLMSFISGLYFRGKLTYARAFARPPRGQPGILVIAPGRGLVPADTVVTPADFADMADVVISAREPRFVDPLRASAGELAGDYRGDAVLLGSIASDKYVPVLSEAFGDRLLFPPDFVGRGDMSRGAMLLRAARAGEELPVAPLEGATRRGRRAARLPPREWGGAAGSGDRSE